MDTRMLTDHQKSIKPRTESFKERIIVLQNKKSKKQKLVFQKKKKSELYKIKYFMKFDCTDSNDMFKAHKYEINK